MICAGWLINRRHSRMRNIIVSQRSNQVHLTVSRVVDLTNEDIPRSIQTYLLVVAHKHQDDKQDEEDAGEAEQPPVRVARLPRVARAHHARRLVEPQREVVAALALATTPATKGHVRVAALDKLPVRVRHVRVALLEAARLIQPSTLVAAALSKLTRAAAEWPCARARLGPCQLVVDVVEAVTCLNKCFKSSNASL